MSSLVLSSPTTSRAETSECPRCAGESYITLFQGTDRLYATTDRVFRVIECGGCGLIRLHPMPGPHELAGFYPESYWWQASPDGRDRLVERYRRLVLQDHVRFVERAIRVPGPLLDIGCGSGSLLRALQDRDIPVCGSEPSRESAKFVWRRHEIPIACSMLPDIPFQPGSFSTVTAFHVLEHLPDPMASLVAMQELLMPGGRIVIQVPNAGSWQTMLLGERWNGFDVPRHLFNFRMEDLEDLLGECGYTIVRRKFFSLRDNPAGLATSLCPRLDPVVRRLRKVEASEFTTILQDALYFSLVLAAIPFTLLEAAAGAGSTVMIEAARSEDL